MKQHHPNAIVVFIGANEGFPMKGPDGRQVKCCGTDYAAVYASRVRQMMNTYRQAGAARIYWLTLPTPRDPDRQKIARTVNAAIVVAAEPWRITGARGRHRADLHSGLQVPRRHGRHGQKKIVRESDGIHLNQTGSNLLADTLIPIIDRDFTHWHGQCTVPSPRIRVLRVRELSRRLLHALHAVRRSSRTAH